MASLVLSGDTSGSITVSAPAVAGSTTQTLVNVTGTLAPIVSGTAQASTSGTSIDFTGIPSWVKRITVMFSGVSTNGTGIIQVQLGSGSFTTSGYAGAAITLPSSFAAFSTGFAITGTNAAARVYRGQMVISNLGSNIWCESSIFGRSDAVDVVSGAGDVTLSGALDRLRIIGSATGSPSDTFDAGTINILYE